LAENEIHDSAESAKVYQANVRVFNLGEKSIEVVGSDSDAGCIGRNPNLSLGSG